MRLSCRVAREHAVPRDSAGRAGAAALALALASTGCLPLVTPPLELGGGGAVRLGGEAGHRLSGGTHIASLLPDPDFPLDVGGGYVQTGSENGGSRVLVHGVYVEGGPRLGGGRFWRAFAGPRAEYYFAPQGPDIAYAGLLRSSIELLLPVELEPLTGGDSRSFYAGVAYGTFALGAYLEGGYQRLPTEAAFPMLGAGIHLRAPLTAGLVCCAWDFASSSK